MGIINFTKGKLLTLMALLLCGLLFVYLLKTSNIPDSDLVHQLKHGLSKKVRLIESSVKRESLQPQDVSEGKGGSSNNVRTFRDVIDNSKAKGHMETHRKIFAPDFSPLRLPNPNNASSIKTWWQAAGMIDWYMNAPVRYECKKIVSYGNWHACQDTPYQVEPPCLVYSFGINFDFTFDDAMGRLGCEVHSFDPSMGKEDHQRNVNVTFHNLGLGAINTDGFVARQDRYVKGRKVWKIRTVKRIKEMLGHENRVIDVFKMDVEGYEWTILDNMLSSGVFEDIRQYMLEFHLLPNFPLREDYVNSYNVYRRMRERGLREYRTAPGPKSIANYYTNQRDVECVNAYFVPPDQRRSSNLH